MRDSLEVVRAGFIECGIASCRATTSLRDKVGIKESNNKL